VIRLGLDLLFLEPGRSGGRETYTRELALRLRERVAITAFVNRETPDMGWWSEAAERVVRVPAGPSSAASWAYGELVALPRLAARAGVDVLHSPANFGPGTGRFRRVLTLHDALFRTHPELHTRAMLWGTEAMVRVAARRAHRVITVSEASATDLRRELSLHDIRVVPNGITPPSGAAAGRFREGDRDVVLAVATDLPHKDLTAVVEAVALVEGDPLLVVAGAGTDAGALAALARDRGVDARFLGAVDPATLDDLYASADVLVTLTKAEGFGLPVLEAMARGVPVVCSDLPVLREVGGPDACYVRGREEAARAIEQALREPPDGDRLRARAAGYTWDAAAEATLAVYDDALRMPSRPARASR
jgi:glycosyltransferase involved in cell wall biosynthesis